MRRPERPERVGRRSPCLELGVEPTLEFFELRPQPTGIGYASRTGVQLGILKSIRQLGNSLLQPLYAVFELRDARTQISALQTRVTELAATGAGAGRERGGLASLLLRAGAAEGLFGAGGSAGLAISSPGRLTVRRTRT